MDNTCNVFWPIILKPLKSISSSNKRIKRNKCLQLLIKPQQKMLSFSLLLIFTKIIPICLGDYTENQYIDYYENQYYDEGGNFDKEVIWNQHSWEIVVNQQNNQIST